MGRAGSRGARAPKLQLPGGANTFIRKKVMLVSKSTVDLRSCSRSGLLAGKLFWGRKKKSWWQKKSCWQDSIWGEVRADLIKHENV